MNNIIPVVLGVWIGFLAERAGLHAGHALGPLVEAMFNCTAFICVSIGAHGLGTRK